MIKRPACYARVCKHLRGVVGDDEEGQRVTCAAFPDGIPDEILDGRNLHLESYPGDHDIQYEEDTEEVDRRRVRLEVRAANVMNFNPAQARDRRGRWSRGMVRPSVGEDIAELKYKGAHEGEVTRYKELTDRRTNLNKKVKAGTATADEHAEAEHVKAQLAEIRVSVRDRYAQIHGREKEKSITGKKVAQGKVKDDVSESGKRDTAKVDKGDTQKVKISEPVKTTGVERAGGPPAVGTAAANAHLVQHLTTLGGTGGGLVHLGDLHTATGWSRQDFEVAMQGARRAGMVTLSGAEGRHGVTERDKASAIYEKDPVTGRADSMLLYASLRSQGVKYDEPKAAAVKLTEGRRDGRQLV
jgi:hypothetical protein